MKTAISLSLSPYVEVDSSLVVSEKISGVRCHHYSIILVLLSLSASIYPSKVHTHSSEHTHTHPEQWATVCTAATGEQLGVRGLSLAQGHLSRGIEGGESAVHSLPPLTISASPRLELATFELRVRLSKH